MLRASREASPAVHRLRLREGHAQERLARGGDHILTHTLLRFFSDLLLGLGYTDPVGPFKKPLQGLGEAVAPFDGEGIVCEGEGSQRQGMATSRKAKDR